MHSNRLHFIVGLSVQRNNLSLSTTKTSHLTSSSNQTKQTSPNLYDDETVDDCQNKANRMKKKRPNEIDQRQENFQKEQVQVKSTLIHHLAFLQTKTKFSSLFVLVIDAQNPLIMNQLRKNTRNRTDNGALAQRQREKAFLFHKNKKKTTDKDRTEDFVLLSTPRTLSNNRQRWVKNNLYSVETNEKVKYDQRNDATLKEQKVININRREKSNDSTHQSKPSTKHKK